MKDDNKSTFPGEKIKTEKEFALTTFALKNKTTVYVVTVLIILAGIFTYTSLPKENFPEIKQPIINIGTTHPGNSPVDMENLITRPIEKELNTIAEIENIKSTSVQNYSTITAEFSTTMNVDKALTKVKDAVDKAKPELPSDLKNDSNINEIDLSQFPIMNINLTGNYNLDELNDYAEYLEEEIEKLSEISKVEIRGVDEKEVRIMVDSYQMEARDVNFGDIEKAIAQENTTLSGGNILNDGVRRPIRIIGEFDDISEFNNIIVKSEKGNIIYLKDIAEIEFGYKEKESYARLAQKPVVMIDVIKRSGENLLLATDKIFAIVKKAKIDEIFPEGLDITITNDQSKQTRTMVSNLENNIISGIILVVSVLLFFLGTRNALFVGIAIPLSMFMSFTILGTFGITINMMVLFSLIMALGMLVDNGIVVVENVYRLMEEGMTPFEATRKGIGEVAWPIISSTSTTLAAFIPLAFWPGIMGEFMKYLPITIIVTLSSSLFVALIINPVLIFTFMRVDKKKNINTKKHLIRILALIIVGTVLLIADQTIWGNLLILFGLLILLNIFVLVPLSNRFQNAFLPVLEGYYKKLLTFALHGWKPSFFFFGTVTLLIVSILLLNLFPPETVFFPINQPKYVNIFVEFPIGTDVEVTNKFTKKIEENVVRLIQPYDYMVESITANIGAGIADPNNAIGPSTSTTPNKSRITINFVEFQYRKGKATSDVMDEIRNGLGEYPGISITVDKNVDGPPAGKPISIELSGNNFVKLIEISEKMKQFIISSGIEGIEKLKSDLETGKPELIVKIDREKARRFGLSTDIIANEIRTSLFGKEISKFKQGEDDYEIQLRLKDKYRYDIDALMNKGIIFKNQDSGNIHQLPISSVATAELSSTYGSVKRKDLKRIVTLNSNVLGGYNPTEVNNQIKELLINFEMPVGYEYKFGGEQEKQAKEMAFLSKALLIAVFIIFLIIVAQFNKITAPFIIMTSVIFSTIGVLLGLIIFRMDFVIIMTMIGIISLAGIVVNNAIVLIDFIELIRNRKRKELGIEKLSFDEIVKAIIDAGTTRLRPVLLTAITTILGLIPLAIGINIDFIKFFNEYDADFYIGGDNVIFWGPMSWTIIFGLTFATFLTLVIVPVMYLFFAKINRRLGVS